MNSLDSWVNRAAVAASPNGLPAGAIEIIDVETPAPSMSLRLLSTVHVARLPPRRWAPIARSRLGGATWLWTSMRPARTAAPAPRWVRALSDSRSAPAPATATVVRNCRRDTAACNDDILPSQHQKEAK